ncbi:unnamed protein product [Linum trigynum]|uniref:TF-B3 domain-containing protein n=1 Tax=Linum trigynum TaxID=586398 RepID=A0AAV2DIT1_9ROSI
MIECASSCLMTSEPNENVNYDGTYALQPNCMCLEIQMAQSEKEVIRNHEIDARELHGDMHGKMSYVHLFQKELTPSDVGKLNRLVIPKKSALKYFSYILETLERANLKHMMNDDVELIFYDKAMKCWKFRYCYWRSS